MNIRFSFRQVGTALLLVVGMAGASPAVRADEASVTVELLGDAPAGDLVASFDGPEADGVGWHRDGEQFQDVGISFRAPSDGMLQKIAFRLEKANEDFSEEIKFRVEVYENSADGENPVDGQKIYSGEGQLALRKSDIGMYPAFTFGKSVPLQGGNFYTVLLIWEADAPVVVFQANPSYPEGFSWIRNERTGGKLEAIVSSGRPGLTFFAQ